MLELVAGALVAAAAVVLVAEPLVTRRPPRGDTVTDRRDEEKSAP